MSKKGFRTIFCLALVFVAFIIIARTWTPVADFYSLHLYPVISTVLSFISSPVRISFQGIGLILVIFGAISIIVRGVRNKEKWTRVLVKEVNVLMWVFVWFYMGWCLNYSRSTLFQRLDVEPSPYDSTAFATFLTDFSTQINEAYIPDCTISEDVLESELKGFYSRVPEKYGLCTPRKWQHSKRMMPQRFHSRIGILGYMGPFFCEFHLNSDLQPSELPSVWAHEYAHVLGISNEDEANWWAWNACSASGVPAIRYSAYLRLYSYVLYNARNLLNKEEYAAFVESVRPEVREEYEALHEYWVSKSNPVLDKMQSKLYDVFLRVNNIPSGVKSYTEVVQMLIDIKFN